MPRPGPARPYIGVRLDDDMLAWVDARASESGVTRSEQIRLMLARDREVTDRALAQYRKGHKKK